MDGFETPYEDGDQVVFINCEICDKSIRGDTLYKLHVTSPGHLQNEEALIAQGKIPRQPALPDFEDIIQYLEYLNLDEPIIGLGYLAEIPGSNGSFPGIKYNCALCKVLSYMTEAVQHVIGRKHRQKYLEKNRPDLVNWDSQRPQTISGKVIRAKAEIAERQGGRGKPKLIQDKTKRQLFPRSFQGGPKYGQGSSYAEYSAPQYGDYAQESSGQVSDYMQERYEDTFTNRTPLGSREMYMEHYTPNSDGSVYPVAKDYSQEDSGKFSVLGFQDQDRRQYGLGQRVEQYNDGFQEPPTQKDVLKEFYTEELRREQLAKSQQWPNDYDSHSHVRTRLIGQGASDSSYSTASGGKFIKDYKHDSPVVNPLDTFANPGPSRVNPFRTGDFSNKISEIPDPFLRFLKGKPRHEERIVKKRKSRFSDATAEELKTAHAMFPNEYGPPNPKAPTLRQDFREPKTQHTFAPLGLNKVETYHKMPRPESSTGDAFEMLQNIDIENEEEANFLKERLCSVLKEFKARKVEASGGGPSRSTQDYNNMKSLTQHAQSSYGRSQRENLVNRRVEEPYDQHSTVSYEERWDEDFQDLKHPVPQMMTYSNKNPAQEVKTWPSNNRPKHDLGYDMQDRSYDRPEQSNEWPSSDFDRPAPFPATFKKTLGPREYQSAEDVSNYHSPTSQLFMEHGQRMDRPPQFSRNLDNITATLLELVKRK